MFDFIGGFSALVQKGYQKGDEILINSIPRALAETYKVCSSVNIGSTKSGINMTAVADMGRIIKETANLSDMGAAKLVVFANAVEDNPFMAGPSMVSVKQMSSSMLEFRVLVLSSVPWKKFVDGALM